jgi:hypothetical protein
VLRPGETDLPPVQVLLSVVASMGTMLGGDAPGEVDGELVPAEMARQLVQALAGRGLSRSRAGRYADHAGPARRHDTRRPAPARRQRRGAVADARATRPRLAAGHGWRRAGWMPWVARIDRAEAA